MRVARQKNERFTEINVWEGGNFQVAGAGSDETYMGLKVERSTRRCRRRGNRAAEIREGEKRDEEKFLALTAALAGQRRFGPCAFVENAQTSTRRWGKKNRPFVWLVALGLHSYSQAQVLADAGQTPGSASSEDLM